MAIGVTAIGCLGAPAIAAPGGTLGSSWLDWTATGGEGRIRFASGLGLSTMLPDGPLSTTLSAEMLSSRQPFSASPSDNTSGAVPATAKIAMRISGPVTIPVSLTSCNDEAASLAEDGVSGWRCVGLDSGSAHLWIFGAAGLTFAWVKRAPDEGRWLLMAPNSKRIRPAQTTHSARIKADKRIIYFNTISIRQ